MGRRDDGGVPEGFTHGFIRFLEALNRIFPIIDRIGHHAGDGVVVIENVRCDLDYKVRHLFLLVVMAKQVTEKRRISQERNRIHGDVFLLAQKPRHDNLLAVFHLNGRLSGANRAPRQFAVDQFNDRRFFGLDPGGYIPVFVYLRNYFHRNPDFCSLDTRGFGTSDNERDFIADMNLRLSVVHGGQARVGKKLGAVGLKQIVKSDIECHEAAIEISDVFQAVYLLKCFYSGRRLVVTPDDFVVFEGT